jgi:hypothetical protein
LGVTASGVITGNTLPSPVSIEGSLFYKSDTDVFYVSNGSAWNLVSNASPATTGGTVTIATINEGGSFNYNIGIDFTDDVDTDGQLIYTLVSGTLPSGCVLPTTGNSSFTGTASGVASNTSYTWSIKVTDTSGGTATQNYQQQINNVPPSFVSPAPGNLGAHFDSNRSVSYTFIATALIGAVTYSVSSGDIPIGTALNGSTGVLSGTASSVVTDTTSSFVIRATDSGGSYIDRSYGITIKAPVVLNFSYSSRSSQSWAVPTGLTQFTTHLWGGGGSAGTQGPGPGGGGGYSWANVTTQPGAIFKLWVPESGLGTDQCGGGGGYAKIVYSSETDANTVAVAGGGGGCGTLTQAGQGGGSTTASTSEYQGASQTSGGSAATCAGSCGSGGTPPFGFWTCAGAHWQGGHGAGGSNDVKGWAGGWPGGGSAGGGNGCNGGGGGGGWYGGGNGGDSAAINGESAAGGSGYVAGITSGSSNIAGAQCTVVTGGSDGGGQTGSPASTAASNHYPGGGIGYGANSGGYHIGGGPSHVAGKGYIVIVY